MLRGNYIPLSQTSDSPFSRVPYSADSAQCCPLGLRQIGAIGRWLASAIFSRDADEPDMACEVVLALEQHVGERFVICH